MNTKAGVARLMTIIWWFLWPLSVVLSTWTAYVIWHTNINVVALGLLFVLMNTSYVITWENKKETSDSIDESPIHTLIEWVFILVVPYVICFVALSLTRDNQGAFWPAIGITLAVLAGIWGVLWMLRGFTNPKY